MCDFFVRESVKGTDTTLCHYHKVPAGKSWLECTARRSVYTAQLSSGTYNMSISRGSPGGPPAITSSGVTPKENTFALFARPVTLEASWENLQRIRTANLPASLAEAGKARAAERELQLMGLEVSQDILKNLLDDVPWDNMFRWTVNSDTLVGSTGPDVLVGGVAMLLVGKLGGSSQLSTNSIFFQKEK